MNKTKNTAKASALNRLIILLLFTASNSLNADLLIDSSLSFGELVVRHNNGVSTTTVTRNGAQSSTHQILIIQPGTPGVYTITDLPPYTTLSLSAYTPVLSEATHPGARFSITAIDLPANVRTDASGSAQFHVGATLSTSGNPAESYQNAADYLIFINIDLLY